jgi:hypothetical protein
MKPSTFSLRLVDAIAYGVKLNESDLSDSEIVSRLEEIRRSFLGEAEGYADLKIETNRTVTGYIFKILIFRDPPHAEARRLFHEVELLGFSNLLDEGTIAIFYSMYCIRQSLFQEAREILEALLAKTEDVLAGPPRVRSSLRRDASRLFGQLPS